ncbi:MAG: VWA domain-containing protein [Phycisphaerales bacterium JB039]
MTLLAPIAAVIAGAIGGAALLAFYLLKLRRRPVRISSILYWRPSAQDQEANVPLRMLRPTLLLLIQALIIALLALAFGRPAIGGGFGGASGVVIIIDQSASMSAPGARSDRSRLDEAKLAARDIVNDALRSGAQLMIVAIGAEARPLTPMTSDRSALRRAIDAIDPTDQPAALDSAARLLSAMTDVTDEQRTDLLGAAFITDGQRAAGSAPLAVPGAIIRERRVGPNEAPENAGIVALAARRDYRDPAPVRISARIARSDAGPQRAVAALLVDGESVERQIIDLGAGSAPATFAVRTSAAATVAITLDIEDALDADNGAALRLGPAPRASVLLVVPEDEVVDDARRSPVWLIADVLRAMDLRALDIVRASRYAQLARDGQLGAWDAIVFDRVTPQAAPPAPSLSFGATVPGAGWVVDPEAPSTRVLRWQRDHPALRDVSLDTVQVGAGALRPAEDGAGGVELAIGRAGPLIAGAEPEGLRRIIVGFAPADSSWPRQAGFPVFIADALDFITLRGEAEAGRMFTTAEPVRLRLSGPREAPTLIGPVEVAGRTVPDGAGFLADFGLLEQAGLYRLQGAAPGDESIAAVNLLDEAETTLAVADPVAPRAPGAAGDSAINGDGSREIWHWFALAALGLSVIEWVLSVWASRR